MASNADVTTTKDFGSGSGSAQKDSSQLRHGLLSFLKTLGLEKYYPNKLTLRALLEINSATLSDEEINSLQAIPWVFLRNLLMVNSKSRSLLSALCEKDEADDLFSDEDNDGSFNLLDLHTALFFCADSFLQQEMALKMSMCQFAIPFVLPQGVHNRSTLMLWALRSILKEWRPHSMSESKGFVEDSVAHAEIPLISFARLSNCSLSKSQVLNQVINNSEQHHDFFSHREMIGGSAPRIIANGMVEMCWTLPCGNKCIDVFPEAVAIANLRGDAGSFETQFRFLTQVSTAVFVFLDSVEENEQRLFASLQEMKSKIFLVVNSQRNMNQNVKSSIEAVIDTLQLGRDHIIKKSPKVNLATFAKTINSAIKSVLLRECHTSCQIESMKNTAQELGLGIDESENKASISAEEMAEKVMQTIGVRQITDYKKTQLPLQGENWKRLAKIEKEQCRLKNSGKMSLEKYKVQLQNEKKGIWKKQNQCKMTRTMDVFIEALSTSDNTERAFFLKWMGLKMDMRSRKHMSSLRHKYKECEQQKDKDAIARLDQELLDCSLGIEHYMREMGQIYEAASFGSNKISEQSSSLPTLAAKLLLAGFPLELLDGDASNIPEKWVSDVLMELHRMVGQKSRLLVITVLGVQSTGKSTLLNTMFGVQFAVGSGRCTRGAFMIFLPVGNDLKDELLCDFILLIDTEGLKSPALAQLEDSYEHDNELATFVIGLSDVTIINIAMENSTEMKDVLQIAVHAFLRMTDLGKKTVCHFVHQNVAGVSAYNKNLTERKQLLDQLNEMTTIAAAMEKKPNIKKFTDVLDYDVEKNNWYIPGLWHGTPPMAPVNTGYSVAVLDFKKSLLGILKAKKDEETSQIPEFLQWMSSVWKAVKFENFIFSFRNSLVAHTYDNLCKEFSEWEWSFRRHIQSWLSTQIVQLSNNEKNGTNEVVEPLIENAHKEITSQKKIINEKLNNYYKKKDRHVYLVEKYKADFANNIRFLEIEMKDEVRKIIDAALEMRSNKKKVEDIHRKQTATIECQVLKLLQIYKDQKDEVSDEHLKAEFERMWKTEVANITGLKERDVPSDVLRQLQVSLVNRNVMEYLDKVHDLTQYGRGEFQVKDKHVKWEKKIQSFFTQRSAKQDLEIIANAVIKCCDKIIQQHAQEKCDYQNTFIKDVLEEIDKQLQQAGSKINTKFELDLKLHICGVASQKFLEMHRKFLTEQDPVKHLQKFKSQYLSDFIDLYRKRDQCHRKARDFTQLCLKPAVTVYIDQTLGPDIVDAVLLNNPTEYSSRVLFQYTIQKDLLEKSNFDDFKKYILQYDDYVKDWIYNHIINCFSKDISLQNLKIKKLDIIMKKIMKAMETSKLEDNGSPLPDNAGGTTRLIQNFCKSMNCVISISMNTVEGVLFQNTNCCAPFTKSLYECVDDMKLQLTDEISRSTDIKETLNNVSVKPQNELFKKVFGCGRKCPFCKTPCEAGGKTHQQHHAAVHRPKGLCGFPNVKTNTLCEEICTSSVHGNGTFQSQETNFEPHLCKDYQKFYPDWHIAPDISIEASDYWKYVMVTFSKQFAESYKAEPAVYPEEWKKITKEQALISLKNNFNIK
ncbi:up-regulator of cell proliferation-like isoform X1 [Ictalurus punctatus]|uniref:Up-regulator of cell proliferation-like isoform X1 n=1 Tax=Ictalurus punctatus TaxID=7998 RepID=A0A2D0RLL2_ICTPU|nr:up-regulator of cell proliferation-like isoform X1 [Ictalurus punctatus]